MFDDTEHFGIHVHDKSNVFSYTAISKYYHFTFYSQHIRHVIILNEHDTLIVNIISGINHLK